MGGGGWVHTLTMNLVKKSLSEVINCEGRNNMGFIVVGYNEDINPSRNQEGATIMERLFVIHILHSTKGQGIMCYCY